jgi:peptidoglycan hydrolase-like protein with peptidoglycan-binding domain
VQTSPVAPARATDGPDVDGPDRPEHAAERVLRLQATAGNRTVARLLAAPGERALQRQPAVLDAPAPTAPAGAHRVLRRNDSGDDVEVLRIRLNASGANPSVPRGQVFDDKVDRAVRAFQRERGLQADGVVGAKTWGALDYLTADRTIDEASWKERSAAFAKAYALVQAGEYKTAIGLLEELYADRRASQEVWRAVVFNLGECHQGLGNFDKAIGYYQEWLAVPDMRPIDYRNANMRIHECRLEQPPGPEESELAERPVPPGVESLHHRTLRANDSGNDVEVLRIRLNASGANPSVPRGEIFDDKVDRAVRAFQREHSLKPDGIVGPKTWGALDFLTAGRTMDEESWKERSATFAKAYALVQAGEYEAALPILEQLYADRRASQEVWRAVAFNLGECHQGLGNFTKAIGYYQEWLAVPDLRPIDYRNANMRIHECRLEQPPGPEESELAERPVPQGIESLHHRTLRVNDSGIAVEVLRIRLNASGANPSVPRGEIFDDKVDRAVRAFQRQHSLEPDGIVGPKTWGALDFLTAGRTMDEESWKERSAAFAKAYALVRARRYATALPLFEELYADRRASQEVWRAVVFNLGECHQGLGNFDKAIGYYQEWLAVPDLRPIDYRNANMRIHECRLRRPPGPEESELAERKVPPGTESPVIR